MRRRPDIVAGFVVVAATLTAASARGQERASIVGLVQDASNAVLPGVTVEAASAELIERTRSVVTDSSGRYAIIDLRPGTYAVTFALPGFKTVKREGIVLEGAFAATVNASMQVGGLEETVTVSAGSPVVDLQSTQNQHVLNREALDALPDARTMQGGAALVPGVSFYTQGFISTMSIHGSVLGDQHIYFDGMNIGQNLTQTGQQANGVNVNELAQKEQVYDAGSQSAETALGGVRMDSIPLEGGNKFSGIARVLGGTGSLQNDNITSELKPSIAAGNALDYTYDVNSVFGGPIVQDRVWFLLAQRFTQTSNLIPLPAAYFPSGYSGPGARGNGSQVESGGQVAPHSTVRLTWQATAKNKIVWAFYKSQGGTQRFDVGCTATSGNSVSCISPEASYWLPTPLQYASQVKWTTPLSNRLLLEVGVSLAVPTYKFKYQPEASGYYDIQHFNSSTSVRTVASSTAPQDYFNQIWNQIANLSYVTGSHNVKIGFNNTSGYERTNVRRNADTAVLTFVNVNGVPTASSATLTNSPFSRTEDLNWNLGAFVQDKWTLKRLTLTYGGRFDYFNASTPEERDDGGIWMSAAARAARGTIAAVPCLPCWKDWSVRSGVSYDLAGNGRTALKVSVGKFLAQQALGLASSVNPGGSQTDTRGWTDLNHDGTIFNADGTPQLNELGVTRNSNFGIPGLGTTQFNPALPRPTNWEETVTIEHELFAGFALAGGFYHRSFQHLEYTTDLARNPFTSWTPFTITVPQSATLPNGGGQVITMYNLSPALVSTTSPQLTWSDRNSMAYNGFEVSVTARFSGHAFLFGGITDQRTATNMCSDLVNSNPNNLRFCNQVPPFQALYKLNAAYTFPWDVSASVAMQWRPGISIGSTYTFNSAVAGVPITGGGTLSVTVVDPTSQYYPYVKTVDARLAKAFRSGRARIEPFVEIYNLPNFSTILTVNETVGPLYYTPGTIVQGRRLQFGGRVDF